jgi:anti-sigma-K factor RskA
MSGTPPTPHQAGDNEAGWDVIAGEYVLGLLDDAAAAALRERARTTPALAAAITAWEQRLDPLADLATPVPPSDTLWPRIARDIRPATAETPRGQKPPAQEPLKAVPPALTAPRTAAPWRGIALATMAVAAGLAIFILQSPPAAPPAPWSQAASLLTAPGGVAPALRAQVTSAGTITVVPLKHLAVNAGEALGFWAWPATEKAPVFLGMIAPDGGQLRFPFPAREGTPVMVTLEHAGATRVTTPGPTLYLGLLVARQG